MAYHVTARTPEIGIRIAMGAQRADVIRMVIGQGARVTLAGIGAGLILSAIAARLLTSLLCGVSATDAATWAGAVAVWLVAAPAARRATLVEPLVALREE